MPGPKDKQPTLASLRARGAKLRSGRRFDASSQLSESLFLGGLFSNIDQSASSQAKALSAEPGAQPFEILRRSEAAAAFESKTTRHVVSFEDRQIWSVRALVADIRQQVETAYADLWVEGEISNCRPASSGHIYFILKDGEAQLPVVLFRRQAQLLRFRPGDGMAVLVRGRISVYDTRGQLQLIAEILEPRGAGALQLAFEQLKARLLDEGLFDISRKRLLPPFPHCIGIITSATGAVIRDIVTVIRRRHARLNLLVYPAIMQGSSSAGSVAAGVRWFNAHPETADLILIARGGGSMEDLACFNEEALARTIAGSQLPVVSAIGHETDFTIADFVADLRAATPSAAAELVTAEQHRVEDRVDALTARIRRAGRFHLMHARQRYARLSAESVLTRLRDAVDRRGQRLDELRLRLESVWRRKYRTDAQRLVIFHERLHRQNAAVRIAATEHRLQLAVQRLQQFAVQALGTRQVRLNRAFTRLEALSPIAVLSRGYALIYSNDGRLLRSASEISAGEAIHARLGQGSLQAQVTRTQLEVTREEISRSDRTDATENSDS